MDMIASLCPSNPFADKLSGWLKTEAGRTRKQQFRRSSTIAGKRLGIAFLASNNGTSFRAINEAIREHRIDAAAVVLISNTAYPSSSGLTIS